MVVHPEAVPMPAAVAARPRDGRGYPVPAITPWPGGEPQFARQSSFRTFICLAERRCSVCGTKMSPGPVWSVADDETAGSVALALDTGKHYINMAPAYEAPGHRCCMIYSAVVCPHLASPGARRKFESATASGILPRGDPRGDTGAVVGYDSYSYQVTSQGLEIYFGQPVELLTFASGEELTGELAEEISREPGKARLCPDYLLQDDAEAEKAGEALIHSRQEIRPSSTARQQEQARRNRRKASKASRRKNR